MTVEERLRREIHASVITLKFLHYTQARQREHGGDNAEVIPRNSEGNLVQRVVKNYNVGANDRGKDQPATGHSLRR